MRSALRRQEKKRRLRKVTAATAIASLLAGGLVVGLTTQMAAADPWAPTVSAQNVDPAGVGKEFVLAGESVGFDVAVSNTAGGAQFNLSLVAIVPMNVSFAEATRIGDPEIFTEGTVLPNRSRTATTDATCVSLGLVDAAGQPPLCAVPAGQQVWVWSNVDDLPQGGTVSSTIKVAPIDDEYPVGSEVSFDIRAYTSDDPSRIPTFDGSRSVSRTTTHTSAAGSADDSVPVKALRIIKDEPSDESEVLRGVHENVVTYTLRVENTTRGATHDVTVVDYLPAGIEYLGLGSTDNSTTGEEYPTSGDVSGGATVGETVETVQLSATEASDLGLDGAGVYTKVTWALPNLNENDKPVIRYTAAVPLFANALWDDGTAPTPQSGEQAANLDNNTGASTRHGGESSHQPAQTFRNVAAVSGVYQGAVLNNDDALRVSTDDDDEIIEAVDVRVIKRVDAGGLFETGEVATYSLQVDVSEYVDARDIVLTDVIPNGLCPALPGPTTGVVLTVGDTVVSESEWNAAVPGDSCNFPTVASGAVLSSDLAVSAITYTPTNGTFTVTFTVADMAANESITAKYSVMQRQNYTGSGGGTSSGDTFINRVTVTATTEPIAAIANDPELSTRVGGARYPSDDSSARITSNFTSLSKTVLERGAAPTDAGAQWLSEAATPFSPGDDVWYRIYVPFATGIDTRNPILNDFLPEGIALQEIKYTYSGIPGFDDVTTPVAHGAGEFPSAFIPNVSPSAATLEWEFGSRNRSGSGDRFMPAGSAVYVYLHGVIEAQSASKDEVDSPLNHAKYQQVNVDGEVAFRRSSAGVDLDWGATLTKGIRTVNSDDVGLDFGNRSDAQEVVQGNTVDYRIDVKAPQNTTTDYVIWDVLPEGVKAADVGAFDAWSYDDGAEVQIYGAGASATAYDPSDTLPPGVARNTAYADRSVIVWTIGASIAGTTAATATDEEIVRGFSLGYTLTVPAGVTDGGPAAQLTQRYQNTAGIVSYGIENSPSTTTTVVPQQAGGAQQLTTRTPQAGEIAVSDIDTVDDATINMPDVTVTKTLVSTEVTPTRDALNADSQIVQGEYVTFEYSVEIPAKTTVRGAVLSDNGAFTRQNGSDVPYEYVTGSARYFGPSGAEIVTGTEPTDFRTADSADGSYGVLTFRDVYTNSDTTPQEFRVQVTMWVKDRDDAAANATVPNIANETTLTNTATFRFLDPAAPDAHLTREGSADVEFVEPEPTLTKTASSAVVEADGSVTFTLTASNEAGRPALYNVVVLDCVPVELEPGTLTTSAGTAEILTPKCAIDPDGAIEQGTGAGTLIEWRIPMLRGDGTAPTLTYPATVDALAGGGSSFTNNAEFTGYTLPFALPNDTNTSPRRGVYTTTADATVRVPDATIDKSVSPGAAAVGDTVTYTLTTSLPARTNFYDVRLTDQLPAGLEFLPGGTHTETTDWAGAPGEPTIGAPTLANGELAWNISSSDVRAWTQPRTITVTFQARITDDVVIAQPRNTATFTWNQVEGSTSPSDRTSTSDVVDVTLLNPEVTIAKRVKITGANDSTYAASAAGNPDASFTYRVRVENKVGAGTAPAHNVVVTDRVDAGVRIDTTQPAFAGATFHPDALALQEGRGGTVTWTLAGPISNVSGSNTVDLIYQGIFVAPSELRPGNLNNNVAVTRYESTASDGWVYQPGASTRPGGTAVPLTGTTAQATVAPRFPQITLNKRVTAGTEAFIEEGFSWTIGAVNGGTGSAQTITLTDTLPTNWEYDSSVTPRLVLQGAAAVDLGAPVLGTQGGKQTLTWTLGTTTGAAVLPGTGSGASLAQRSLSVAFSAKPLPAALVDAGAGLDRNHRNTVAASVTDTTGATSNAAGSYTGANANADAHIGRANLKLVKSAIGGNAQNAWLAGATAVSGYVQPQWQITITNQGPDAASGQFRVIDETVLPAGVTTGAFSARYYASASDTVGSTIALTGAGTSANPFLIGTNASRLKADGSDRIVLVADVTIAPTVTGTATNTASVTGRTYERPEDLTDNSDDASKTITTAADLAVTKTVGTSEPTAGRPITWNIAVRNAGPSVSLSSADARITVTDVIPAGITDVADPSGGLTSWTVAASNGWPATAGDTITWTYTGTQLAVGPAQSFSLEGVIESSWTGGVIRNAAVVHPGGTPDPNSANNTSEVPATPGDSTTLGITKTRVIQDGGVWKDAAQYGAALPDVLAGQPINYRISVTNNGPADARGVTVVDEVPGSLTYASVANETGSWTRTAGPATNDTFALAGTIPAQAGSNTRSFIVTYTVDSALPAGSEVVNWANASATNATNNPRDFDTNASDRVADLAIVKRALDTNGDPVADGVIPKVTAGTQLRFLLTVTNNGPSVSSGAIEISDALPAGMTYASSRMSVAGSAFSSVVAAVSTDQRSLSWTGVSSAGTLASGATIVIEVTVDVAAGLAPQRLVNAVTVTGPDDSNPGNNYSTATVDVVRVADMTISKDALAGPWIAGTNVEYEVIVDNAGPSVADAYVTDLLPSGLTPVSIVGTGWDCDDDTQSCVRLNHPVGASTIIVTARIGSAVATGTVLTNEVTLRWLDSRDTSPHETGDDADITVTTSADLALVKEAVDASGTVITTAIAGESARYRITAENLGPSAAVGPVTVVDTLPDGISFTGLVGASAATWRAEVSTTDPQEVTFTLLPETAGLARDATAPVIEFEVLIDESVAHDAVLTNSAVVASGTPDPVPGNNIDTAELTIAREVDLSITKTHDADSVRIGDDLEFTLGVRNAGPSEATDVVVTDVVPGGLEVLTAVGDNVGSDWSIVSVTPVDPLDPEAGTEVVASYAQSLRPGDSANPLTLRTRVLVSAYATVVNVAEVTAAEITATHPDRTPEDNRAEDPVLVPALAALVVEKTAIGTFQAGKSGEYRIVVRNDGPTADPGPITVTDALPSGLTFAGSPDAGVTVNGNVVTWTLANGLEVDESVTLTLRVNVGSSAFPSVRNVVTVVSPSEQTPQAQLEDDDAVSVKAADPLAVTGGMLAWGLVLMAVLLMLSGALFLMNRRRRARIAL